jgi:hypothetical protein
MSVRLPDERVHRKADQTGDQNNEEPPPLCDCVHGANAALREPVHAENHERCGREINGIKRRQASPALWSPAIHDDRDAKPARFIEL